MFVYSAIMVIVTIVAIIALAATGGVRYLDFKLFAKAVFFANPLRK